MIRPSVFIVLLSTVSLISAARDGVITVTVNTTTTVNGTLSEVEQESVALNYTIGELGNEQLDWNNEWTAEETGADEYELVDGAGDIIYLVPNGPDDQDANIDEILSTPAVSPSGGNNTVGSYVGNSLARAYSPEQAQVKSQTTNIAVTNTTTGSETPAPVSTLVSSEQPVVANVPEAAVVPIVISVPAINVTEVVSEAVEAVEEVAESLASIVSDVEQTYENVEGVVEDTYVDATEAVESIVEDTIEDLEAAAIEAGELDSSILVRNATGALENVFNNATEAPVSASEDSVEAVEAVLSDAGEEAAVIVNQTEAVLSSAVNEVENVLENLLDTTEYLAYEAGEGFGDVVNEVESVAESIVEYVESGVENARNTVRRVRNSTRAVGNAFSSGYNNATNNQ